MVTKAITTLICLFVFLNSTEPKVYSKEYHANGSMKAEGWLMGTTKTQYWKFYHENGSVSSEGHYKNNERVNYWHFYNSQGELVKEGHYETGNANDWWIFYDLVRQEKQKIEYVNNQKNGYCLSYKNNKLIRASTYENDQLIGSWTSIREFRQDNPGVSLFSL